MIRLRQRLRRGKVRLRTFQLVLAAAMLIPSAAADVSAQEAAPAAAKPAGPIRRLPDGKPDLNGHFASDNGGANWGLEFHPPQFGLPPGRGVIIDPPDKKLPLQPWAAEERKNRGLPERGYDDPTAHCFVAGGVPRSFYVPSPFHIVHTPGHVAFLFERMAWRVVPLTLRPHIADNVRLWQGDSVGRWEGDTLVVETKNFNGKTWLNEVGDIVSHAEHVVERFTPVNADTINYQATVTDPVVYTRPWTIAMPLNRQTGDILEVACHEDNQDLQHLKDIRDEARAKAKQQEQGR